MHRILILGPQGSGKGTQAQRLADKLEIPALSMGQLLRDEIASGSEFGEKLQAILNAGNLVSDEDALEVLSRRLQKPDAQKGYILDGYPRNMAQFEAAKALPEPTALLVITVPKEESLARMLKRAELEQRADDTPEVIEKRLAIYEEKTKPVIDAYNEMGIVHMIDGIGTMEEVEQRIHTALNI